MRKAWAWCRTREGRALLILLALSGLIRLPLMPFKGFFNDMDLCIQWGIEAQMHPLQVYSFSAAISHTPVNYPPLAIYIYGTVVGLYDHFVQHITLSGAQLYLLHPYDGLIWLLKFPVLLGDLGLIAVLYLIGRRVRPRRHVLIAVATYAVCPAVLIMGVLWGQLDNITTCFLLLSLLLIVERHDTWAGVALALACLTKPQPIIFVPLVLVYLWRWRGWRQTARTVVAMVATALVVCAVYLVPPQPQILALYGNIQIWLNRHPETSPDAYNLWTVLGATSHRANTPFVGWLTTSEIGWILFALVFLVVCAGIWLDASPARLFFGTAIVACAVFDVAAQQHERYLYPAMALFLAAALSTKRSRPAYVLYGLICLTCTLNLIATAIPVQLDPQPAWFLPPALTAFAHVLRSGYQTPIAILNLLILLAALAVFVKDLSLSALRPSTYQASSPLLASASTGASA